MTTFITFIGKGRKRDNGRFQYETVNYRFVRSDVRASCFANAVMRSGEYVFDRVIVIGTMTSTWSQLLEEPAPEEEELFLALDGSGINESGAQDHLTDALKKRWNVPDVRLLVHQATVTGNEEQIMAAYLRMLLETTGNIVLDVTHSFRWMPQLFASALQLADTLSPPRQVEFLYGEMTEDKSNCPVRKLRELRPAEKLAQDIRMFFEKWEAEPLAAQLDELWPEGAKSLRVLGLHLQGNYLLPLAWNPEDRGPGAPLLQLANALKVLRARTGLPLWLTTLQKRLEDLRRKLADPPAASHRLWNLAELYAERLMFGQALLCQECALRLFIWEKCGNADYPAWEQLTGATKIYAEKQKKLGFPTKKLYNILGNRNIVAHGALRGRGESAGIPAAANLPKQFQSQQEYLKNLMGITG